MRRNIAFLTMTFVLLAGLVYLGLPKSPSPIRALRVSRLGSTAKPAWSSTGEKLVRANAGHIFVYDLAKYIYNDPRIARPVLVGEIMTPGIERLEWSPDDKVLLAEISTYDIFNSFMLIDLKTEMLRTLVVDDTKNSTADFFFWRSATILGTVMRLDGLISPYPQGLLAVADTKSGIESRDDGFLNTRTLSVFPQDRTGIEIPTGYDVEYESYFHEKYLLGRMLQKGQPANLFTLDSATGKSKTLAVDIDDFSVAANGRAVVLRGGSDHVRLAEISSEELKVGRSLTFEDQLGRQLRPAEISISPNGRFIAFVSGDPFSPGTYVAPLP